MADPANIFSKESEATLTPDAVPETVNIQEPSESTDQFADLLRSITAEDGRQKFEDVPKALESIPFALRHIARLEQESAEKDTELAKRKTAEELLEGIQPQSRTDQEKPSSPALDEQQLSALVARELTAQKTVETQKGNVQKVTASMAGKYGEKAEEVFYSTAKSLGMSAENVNELAARSPEAVLKLMGVLGSEIRAPSKSSSSVNTEVLTPQEPKADLKFKDGQSMDEMVNVWRSA